MADTSPIFLVGVPRSGTTLLSAMLCAHNRLSCGPETHFFDAMTDALEARLITDAAWPQAALDYLFSGIAHGRKPIPENYGLSREEIADYLRMSDKTIAVAASALPELFMRKLGKARWVEKTPDHHLHGPRIRKHFPHAPILRIIRDPRDVALSLNRVFWGPQTFLEGVLYWYRYQQLSGDFFEKDSLSHTVRYEDLLADPERELTKICRFIGEDFEPGMLDTTQSAPYLAHDNEPWKKKVAEKVDSSRAHAWKERLTEEEKRQANAIIGGYTEEREALAGSLRYVRVNGLERAWSGRDLYILRQLIQESDVRFWPATPEEKPIKTLTVGQGSSALERKLLTMLQAVGVKEWAKNLWYRCAVR